MRKRFRFGDGYVKFCLPVFPVVRGRNALDKYGIDEECLLISPTGEMVVKIVDKYHHRIKSLTRCFMKLDATRMIGDKLFLCKNVKDYLALLNSFVPRASDFRYGPDSVVTVFWVIKKNWIENLYHHYNHS